jgi:hypothetical protein
MKIKEKEETEESIAMQVHCNLMISELKRNNQHHMLANSTSNNNENNGGGDGVVGVGGGGDGNQETRVSLSKANKDMLLGMVTSYSGVNHWLAKLAYLNMPQKDISLLFYSADEWASLTKATQPISDIKLSRDSNLKTKKSSKKKSKALANKNLKGSNNNDDNDATNSDGGGVGRGRQLRRMTSSRIVHSIASFSVNFRKNTSSFIFGGGGGNYNSYSNDRNKYWCCFGGWISTATMRSPSNAASSPGHGARVESGDFAHVTKHSRNNSSSSQQPSHPHGGANSNNKLTLYNLPSADTWMQQYIKLKPYGVLGMALNEDKKAVRLGGDPRDFLALHKQEKSVDKFKHGVCVVDPAGLHHIIPPGILNIYLYLYL